MVNGLSTCCKALQHIQMRAVSEDNKEHPVLTPHVAKGFAVAAAKLIAAMLIAVKLIAAELIAATLIADKLIAAELMQRS